jgi:hypothetical protein
MACASAQDSPPNLSTATKTMSDRLQITDARDGDRAFIIECIGGLQDHEVALHDTRLQTSAAPLERYFEAISTRAQANGGAVLVAWAQDGPVGFICFWIDHASTLLETADSTEVAISVISTWSMRLEATAWLDG